MKKLILIMTMVSVFFSITLQAQNVTVPICGKVEVVNADLAKKLQLFPEYKGFQQALVYQEGDNSYILEIIYKPDDIFKVKRIAMTSEDLSVFCKKIDQSEVVIDLLNQKGRGEVIISSTISGLGLYAWAIPQALNIEETRPFIASYMLIGGSSFFAPFLLTKNAEVTRPMARAYTIGTGAGVGHGFIIRNLLELNNTGSDYDFRRSQRRLLIPTALGIGESLGFMALTKKNNLSLSNVGMITTGGVWGTGWGAGVGNLLIVENDEYKSETIKVSIGALIGSGAGGFLGHVVHKKMPNMTNGDVITSNAYGILGTLYAATLVDLVVDFESLSDEKVMISSMALGSIGGLAYGLSRTTNFDYTTAEGSYIGLAEIAGGLLGIGSGYLLSSSDELTSKTALVSASIGSTIGIFVMDRFLRNRSISTTSSIGQFDFNFNPLGISNAFNTDNSQSELTIEEYQRQANNHIIRIGVTF